MQYINAKITQENRFFEGNNPLDIIQEFGSPLYVYNERILRERLREMKNLVSYPNFGVSYSSKANCNLALLQIVKSEGVDVDAMSDGEIYVQQLAGFDSSRIFYVCNNVSKEEMVYAIERGILISIDSLSQLEQLGEINPGGKVSLRINPGIGAGHHEKVVTAGKNTKFGISVSQIPQAREIVKNYGLQVVGLNQHIGSLVMDAEAYVASVNVLLDIAKGFDNLDFIDIGGGFGIPYNKQKGESRLDLSLLGGLLTERMYSFAKEYGKQITFKIEPGRYITAEFGVLLGTVNTVKENSGIKYVGSDLGFNVLIRPAMYDSKHEIEIYRESEEKSIKNETVRIVGNICETGDVLVKDIDLPEMFKGDILGVLDCGAYGFSMSSNYNNRLRPAEVLITESGDVRLIRKRDSFEDLSRNFIPLY